MKAKHHSLQRTILGITFIFTLLIGAILSGFIVKFYTEYMEDAVVQNTNANLSFMRDSINGNIAELSRLSFFCETHLYIGEFLSYSDVSQSAVAIRAYERLAEEYRACPVNAGIHRMIIGNEYNKYIQIVDPPYSTSRNVDRMTRGLEAYEEQIQKAGYDFSGGYQQDPYVERIDKKVLLVVRPISYPYRSERGGYVCFSLAESFFTAPMRYYAYPEDSTLYLTLGEHMYRMDKDALTEITQRGDVPANRISRADWDSGIEAFTFAEDAGGRAGILVRQPLSVEGCYISQMVSSEDLASYKALYPVIVLSVICLMVFVGILLSAVLYRVIDVPVAQIQKRLSRISSGDFDRDASIEWKHELGDIGRGINDLSRDIQALLEERVQDAKDKKDLEYKMLQSQINPHFLYNTLNSIKWMALTQGSEGIAEMTTALSRLMRSVSKGARTLIPIRDELGLVSDYFTIQQYRYGGGLKLNVTVEDEALYDSLMIKFTLQPIVENAIFHGIEPKQAPGVIDIRVYRGPGDAVCIDVRDNGIGMSAEKIQSVFSEEASDKDKSRLFAEIGIANIRKRIQYEFGAEYGISIESEPGAYTRMTIHIPDKKVLSDET